MFKKVSRGPFVEESDADSVASNTTAESEQQDVYNVDEILAEDRDFQGTGETHYLLKWTGYSMNRCSWEPREHIESASVLKEWDRRKRRVQRGEVGPFDVDAWDAMMFKLEEEKMERQRKRKEKRRKRGIPVSSSDEAYEDDVVDVGVSPRHKRIPRLDSDDEEVVASAKPAQRQKTVKAPLVKRKGVAQKITSTRLPIDSSSDEEDVNEAIGGRAAPDSDLNSLSDEGSQPLYLDLEKPAAPAARPKVKAAPLVKPPPSAPNPIRPAAPLRPSAAPAARKQAPTIDKNVGTAKRTKNIFGNFAETTTKRKQRARVSGETLKDSAEPRFKRLSQQNRFQKYSRNESAPDIDLLTIIDPKTGNTKPPNAASAFAGASITSGRRGPEEIPSVYGRRRSPPRAERQRSATPPQREPSRVTAPDDLAGRDGRPVFTVAPSGRTRTQVCWHWLDGTCRETAETCNFAHYRIDPNDHLPQFVPEQQLGAAFAGVMPSAKWAPPSGDWAPKKETTCYFWLRRECTKPEEVCEFTHRFTGTFPHLALRDTDLMRKVTEAKNTTCRDWAQGQCVNSEDQCKLAHRHTGVIASGPESFLRWKSMPSARAIVDDRKNMTCFFWQQGRCKKSDDVCAYAHHYTGVMAGPPPGHTMLGDHSPIGLQPSVMSPIAKSVMATEPPVANAFSAAIAVPAQAAGLSSATMPSVERNVRFQFPQEDVSEQADVDTGVLAATIEVHFGGGQHGEKIHANLHVSVVSKMERLFFPIHNCIHLAPDSMVNAKDFEVCLADLIKQGAQWPAGSIVPVDYSRNNADKLAECCKLHASGFVSVQDDFTLVIYPARDEEWRFLDSLSSHIVPNAPLRFRFLPPVEGLVRRQGAVEDSSMAPVRQRASVLATRELLGIDAERLLVEKEGRQPDTGVFLAWPQEHETELQTIVKCFQDLNCKVYHSGTPGAWQYYWRKYKSFLVIVHPHTPLWEIPRLHSLLTADGRSIRVFSIGVQPSMSQTLEGSSNLSCERLFPHGRVTFITDDVLVNHPEKASEVIQLFLDSNRHKPVGGENDKIVTRPGVKDWLRQLAVERTTDRGRQDNRWLQLYYDVCQLCPPVDEDPYDPPNPLPQSNLVSFPPEQLPSFVGLWERDPEKATDAMVEWFAGWSVLNANKFRRFSVCHEPQKGAMVMDENGRSTYHVDADPRGWSKKWQHIGVLRPEQIIKKPKSGK